MFRPMSFIIQSSRALNTTARALKNPVTGKPSLATCQYIFTTDHRSSFILEENNALKLKFKTGGYQEDNKKTGILWTLQGQNRTLLPRLDKCIKQKLVRVTTNSGEKVMAIACNTESFM